MKREFQDGLIERVVSGAARAFWLCAWANYHEGQTEEDEAHELPWPPGSNLDDHAPETPLAAWVEGARLIGAIEQKNSKSIHVLVRDAIRADRQEKGRDEEEPATDDELDLFGHYMAMEAMGHGVSWFDDHAHFEVKIPHAEWYWFPVGGLAEPDESENEDIPDSVFVHGEKTYCADCIPPELRARLGDSDVETWRYLDTGWVSAPICDECKLSIPVICDAGEGEL